MKSYRELDPLRRVAHERGGQAGVEPDKSDMSPQVTVVGKAITINRVHRDIHITVKAYVLWSGLSVSEPTMGTHTSEEPAKQCQQSERLMGTQQADAEMFEQHAGAAHSSGTKDPPAPRKHMNHFARGRRDTWQCTGQVHPPVSNTTWKGWGGVPILTGPQYWTCHHQHHHHKTSSIIFSVLGASSGQRSRARTCACAFTEVGEPAGELRKRKRRVHEHPRCHLARCRIAWPPRSRRCTASVTEYAVSAVLGKGLSFPWPPPRRHRRPGRQPPP
jgi:hypothetical protein